MGNYDINFDHDNGHLVNLGGRAFIASATPWFFTVNIIYFLQPYYLIAHIISMQHYGPDTWNKNWIYRTENWHYVTRWEHIIQQRNRIDAVEVRFFDLICILILK